MREKREPFSSRGSLLIILAISFLLTLAGCGMQANVGSHTAYGAATDYISALADKDYDRARALRDPAESKQTAFDNGYFDDERTRLGISVANPQFTNVVIKDATGNSLGSNDNVTTASAYITLSVVSGPSLLITTTFSSDLWYVSGIVRRLFCRGGLRSPKQGGIRMPINMGTDKATMSAALQKAGYDLSGTDPNLIQARLDRGSEVVNLYIDAGGSVRAQVTMGGGENEQQQRSGNLQYTIVRQGQITLNITTRLTSASDLSTLIADLNNISATRLAATDAGNAATSWAHTQPSSGYTSMAQSGGSGGRVSASNFSGGEDSSSSGSSSNSGEFSQDTSSGFGGAHHSGSQHSGTSSSGGRVSASNFTGASGSDNQPSDANSGSGNSSNTSSDSGGRVSASDFGGNEGGN